MCFFSLTNFLLVTLERSVFDGKYGQVVRDGHFFVYTVNASYLPSPPSQECELQLMRDCRFGQYDPVLWPQLFTESFPHHAVIRNLPSDPSDHSSWWWWLPEHHHVVFSLSAHLGLLRRDITESFLSSIQILRDRVDHYCESQSRAGHEPNTTPFLHMTVVENNYQQLLTLESSFHQICLCIVEMQNTYHFALAALDWLEVFVPRYNGLAPSASEVAGVMGAFVYNIKQASHLVQCGVPVWIVHRFGDLSATRVDELLPISEPSDMLDLTPAPGSAVIFRGSPGSEALRYMVRYYSRSLAGVNPFIITTPSTSSHPLSASMPVSSTSSCDAHRAKPCKY